MTRSSVILTRFVLSYQDSSKITLHNRVTIWPCDTIFLAESTSKSSHKIVTQSSVIMSRCIISFILHLSCFYAPLDCLKFLWTPNISWKYIINYVMTGCHHCWSKNLFDECFNDNKPRGINDKFYEWWSTDVCTWVFVKRKGIT